MGRIPVNQPYTVTTEFGVPDSNALFKRHSGIDYGVPAGRPIYAPSSGELSNIISPTGGNMVVIFDGKYYHRLMHNNSFSRAPGRVNEGEEVAKAGSTGLSTGVHSHWDINTQGVYPTSFSNFINPIQWLSEGEVIVGKVTIKGSPASISWDNGRIDVFACGTDNGIWHKWFNGAWQSWERIGDGTPDLSVASWAEGRLDIFFRGVAGDLVHIHYSDGKWSVPESLGIPKEV